MKKIPTRNCIGCGEQKHKIGKLSGRGAYICDNSECLEKAIRSKKIEKAFEMKIEENIYEDLKNTINQGV